MCVATRFLTELKLTALKISTYFPPLLAKRRMAVRHLPETGWLCILTIYWTKANYRHASFCVSESIINARTSIVCLLFRFIQHFLACFPELLARIFHFVVKFVVCVVNTINVNIFQLYPFVLPENVDFSKKSNLDAFHLACGEIL